MSVVNCPSHTLGAIGGTGDRTQKTKFVGGRLGIVENDVSQQRQRAGPVVRQAHHDLDPGDFAPAKAIEGLAHLKHRNTMVPGQRLDLANVNRIHVPVSLGWA